MAKKATFDETLAAAKKIGASHASDTQLLAMLCDAAKILGAYSPQLLFEGAQKQGLTAKQFGKLMASKDPMVLSDLQFV